MQILHFPITAYRPQGDGQTERINVVLEAYLRHYINHSQDDWDKWIALAEFAYNNSKHSAINETPFYAYTGHYSYFDIVEAYSNNEATNIKAKQRIQAIQDIRDVVEAKLIQTRNNMAKYYDPHRKNVEFNVGDQVYLKTNHIRSLKPSKKLDNRKYGPFTIINRIGSRAYRLKLPSSLKIHNVFNADTLIPFKESIIDG